MSFFFCKCRWLFFKGQSSGRMSGLWENTRVQIEIFGTKRRAPSNADRPPWGFLFFSHEYRVWGRVGSGLLQNIFFTVFLPSNFCPKPPSLFPSAGCAPPPPQKKHRFSPLFQCCHIFIFFRIYFFIWYKNMTAAHLVYHQTWFFYGMCHSVSQSSKGRFFLALRTHRIFPVEYFHSFRYFFGTVCNAVATLSLNNHIFFVTFVSNRGLWAINYGRGAWTGGGLARMGRGSVCLCGLWNAHWGRGKDPRFVLPEPMLHFLSFFFVCLQPEWNPKAVTIFGNPSVLLFRRKIQAALQPPLGLNPIIAGLNEQIILSIFARGNKPGVFFPAGVEETALKYPPRQIWKEPWGQTTQMMFPPSQNSFCQ